MELDLETAALTSSDTLRPAGSVGLLASLVVDTYAEAYRQGRNSEVSTRRSGSTLLACKSRFVLLVQIVKAVRKATLAAGTTAGFVRT